MTSQSRVYSHNLSRLASSMYVGVTFNFFDHSNQVLCGKERGERVFSSPQTYLFLWHVRMSPDQISWKGTFMWWEKEREMKKERWWYCRNWFRSMPKMIVFCCEWCGCGISRKRGNVFSFSRSLLFFTWKVKIQIWRLMFVNY